MSKPRPLQVLLAVADKRAGELLSVKMRERGWACKLAANRPQAEMLLTQSPDLLVLEHGCDILPLQQLPGMALVVLAQPEPDAYFQAAKAGADAVLALPIDLQECSAKLDAVSAPILARLSTAELDPIHTPGLFATSQDMAKVRELIEKVAPTSATVLIRGESGVGKELAAQLIHSRSSRSNRPFIRVNCAAIPNELLESELFGYEAGAFTGAIKGKPGKFELADGGTIFLDEIGELHPALQAKLLHVLQGGEFSRLGSKRDTAVDVRVICATNKLLDALVANGLFREDLFYRINVVTVSLPPLRSRTREIPVLVDFFLQRYSAIYNKPLVRLDAAAMQALTAYHWPGNIRELENLVKRYVIVGGIDQIIRDLDHRRGQQSSERVSPSGDAGSSETEHATQNDRPSLLEIGRRAAWTAERAAIESTLNQTHWNRREAARLLGVSYKALLNKIALMKQEQESQEVVAV